MSEINFDFSALKLNKQEQAFALGELADLDQLSLNSIIKRREILELSLSGGQVPAHLQKGARGALVVLNAVEQTLSGVNPNGKHDETYYSKTPEQMQSDVERLKEFNPELAKKMQADINNMNEPDITSQQRQETLIKWSNKKLEEMKKENDAKIKASNGEMQQQNRINERLARG